jgi:hypothetical protein
VGSFLFQRSAGDSSDTDKAVMAGQVDCMVGGPLCSVVGMCKNDPDCWFSRVAVGRCPAFLLMHVEDA